MLTVEASNLYSELESFLCFDFNIFLCAFLCYLEIIFILSWSV